MSATGRGARRIDSDFYPTPRWCTEALLNYWPEWRLPVLDPCAGDGAVLYVAQARGLATHGIELRDVGPTPGTNTFLQADALSMPDADAERYRDCSIITNPPYNQAQQFIEAWRGRVRRSAWLLRVNFAGSQKRAEWFRAWRPSHILILPKRPSFVQAHGKRQGSTDSCEYAWFIWQQGRQLGSNFDWLKVKP